MRIPLVFFAFILFSAEKCEPVDENAKAYASETIIAMEKSGCFGSCPIYKFSINGDGTATYKGTRFVKKMGDFSKTFPPKQINALIQIFENADFWEFDDEYTDNVTDLPTTFLSFTHEEQTKRIRMYYNVPQELINLSKLVESYANSDGWESTILK